MLRSTSPRDKRQKRSGVFSSSGINKTPTLAQLETDLEQERMKIDYEFELRKLELEVKFRERGLER